MKWENLVSVHSCRQSSRVLTSGRPKQKRNCNCRRFSTEINRVQLLWHPLCPSPFYPNLVSHCSNQQVWFSFSRAVTGTLCRGCQGVTGSWCKGTPGRVLMAKWDMLKLQSQQRKMCANTSWSPVTSQELCKKMWLGESQSTNTDLGNKGTNSVKINMNVMEDWKAFEQIEWDFDLNHIVKISSQIVQGQQTQHDEIVSWLTFLLAKLASLVWVLPGEVNHRLEQQGTQLRAQNSLVSQKSRDCCSLVVTAGFLPGLLTCCTKQPQWITNITGFQDCEPHAEFGPLKTSWISKLGVRVYYLSWFHV